jgi:hypothetical protein
MLNLEVACFTRIRAHVRDFFKMFLKHPANNKGKITLGKVLSHYI